MLRKSVTNSEFYLNDILMSKENSVWRSATWNVEKARLQ